MFQFRPKSAGKLPLPYVPHVKSIGPGIVPESAKLDFTHESPKTNMRPPKAHIRRRGF